ncbi:hypothetical protein SDC9_197533 [bioreactor metagenome]|uniref:Uncharacterized protein n=1 Tax=bioreactor metagenome TaxID=1076179 RepID=A0A645IHF3_9ZZZZ
MVKAPPKPKPITKTKRINKKSGELTFSIGSRRVLINRIPFDITMTVFPPYLTMHLPKTTEAISQDIVIGTKANPDIFAS